MEQALGNGILPPSESSWVDGGSSRFATTVSSEWLEEWSARTDLDGECDGSQGHKHAWASMSAYSEMCMVVER